MFSCPLEIPLQENKTVRLFHESPQFLTYQMCCINLKSVIENVMRNPLLKYRPNNSSKRQNLSSDYGLTFFMKDNHTTENMNPM